MLQDLARFAQRYQVELNFNPHFPINTLLLMRATTGVQMHLPERFIDFIDCLFRALWVDKRNLNDAASVAQVLEQGGFRPTADPRPEQCRGRQDRSQEQHRTGVAAGSIRCSQHVRG